MQRFTELDVWKRGHALTLAVYRLSAKFPSEERYGLTSQLRRAMSSVPINIAEGSKRSSNRDYARFLNIAESSLVEAEYELMLAKDLGYISGEALDPILKDIDVLARMLNSLRSKVDAAS